MTEDKAAPTTRRIRTDGLFFAALVVISAFYVVLIIAMLAADATYIFTSDMRKDAAIDFESFGPLEDEESFESDQIVARQYQDYGLTVSAGAGKTPMIFNSRLPRNSPALGSPHNEFRGPGIGEGGGRSVKVNNQNILPQRHVLIVSDEENEARPASGRLVFQWDDPVTIDRVHLLNVNQLGGAATLFDEQGKQIARRSLRDHGENSMQSVRLGVDGVARMELELPGPAAVTEIEFNWHGRVRTAWERKNPLSARLFHNPITAALQKREIQYSIKLSLITCTITAILSLWVAIPIGYLLSRHQFFGRNLIDAVLDIPIVLPPLVVGLSLLILFQFFPRAAREAVVYQIPAVILAQFMVACAFAVRTMRATFDQIDPRQERVALTLGCSRAQAFLMVVLPEAGRGIITAGTLAWARSLGEFGPLLIFAGATRMKTEVLSTTVFLEMSLGDLGAAVAVSLIMVAAAIIVLVLVRLSGARSLTI